MIKKIDVICIGAAIVDIPLHPVNRNIFEIESYPIENIAMTIGGDAINEAIIISRLGYSTALMSLLGNDPAGKFVLEACVKNNIDISGILVSDDIDTSINIGLVTEDGERTFVTNKNGSLWKIDRSHVDTSRFMEARLLTLASIFNNPLLTGEELVKIFVEAKKAKLIICADMIKPRLGEVLEDIRVALSYVDFFFPNYAEASLLTGKVDLNEIADTFLECGAKNVIIKNGKKGCFIKNKDGTLEVPAVQGINAIDTIGAGDNFVAGFITAILDGKNLIESAKYANATASISVQSIGATTGVKSREQVIERYERSY
ncbi:MAG: sugar kinase [Vallitaleaceae bacterium]|nr:sugar kinase [Vallitaleaceae bacterium]